MIEMGENSGVHWHVPGCKTTCQISSYYCTFLLGCTQQTNNIMVTLANITSPFPK